MKRFMTLLGILLMPVVIMVACSSETSSPAVILTFRDIGVEGTTVFSTLVSPSPDAVSPQDLANGLRERFQNALVNGQVHVLLFDNTEAPNRWIELWPNLATMSDEDWAKEQAKIFPHWIASYDRNKNTGLHEVKIKSRDVNGDSVQTIKF
jgi:hypothetical protein